jgi:hypothetical protein
VDLLLRGESGPLDPLRVLAGEARLLVRLLGVLALLLLLTSRKTHPPSPPFDGCNPTLSPVTLYIS